MFQDHVLDYEDPSPLEATAPKELPVVKEANNDPESELMALYVSGLEFFTTDQDLELLVTSAGQSDKFLPLELTFKEDKLNGKSKGEAFLKFTSHDAAAAVKKYIESSTLFKVGFANLATKPNPFRETPADLRQSRRESQSRNDRSYEQHYYDQARAYYQNASRSARMGRYAPPTYQSTPYSDRNSRNYRDSDHARHSRDRDRRSDQRRDQRYSNDRKSSQERDSRY